MKKWLWLLCLSSLFLLSCNDEQQVIYEERPTQEKIYVQDDSGKWIEYAMFMALMQNQGRTVDVHHYHYGTSNGNGGFNDYKPNVSEYNQMKNRSYKGTTIINKKVVVNNYNNKTNKNSNYKKQQTNKNTKQKVTNKKIKKPKTSVAKPKKTSYKASKSSYKSSTKKR